MERWRGKVAIVTGASSGIGAATARALVSRGLTVVGMDIQHDTLKELADEVNGSSPGKILPLKADLRKEEEIQEGFRWVDKELGGADILFNNAGVGLVGNIQNSEVEDWRKMLEVNVLAVLICSQLFLQSLDRRNNQNGHIINMGSMTGHVCPPSPVCGVYAATKFAIKAISMSLRAELAEKNSTIKVSTVSPGLVMTDIYRNATTLKSHPKTLLEPEDIANTVIDILSAPSHSQICDVILNPVPTEMFTY